MLPTAQSATAPPARAPDRPRRPALRGRCGPGGGGASAFGL